MKIRMAAFALLLLAGTAPAAMAQDHGRHGDDATATPREHGGRGGGEWRGGDRGWRGQPAPTQAPAPTAGATPQAQTPPPMPMQRQGFEGRRGGRWEGGERPGFQPQRAYPQAQGRPAGEEGRHFGARPDAGQVPSAERGDRRERGEPRQWPRYGGAPQVQDPRQIERPRNEGDRRSPDGRWVRGDGRGGDDRGVQRWSGDRNWDGNRRWDGDRHRDGDRRGHPQWRPGAYPHSYASGHRFHVGGYRRPPNFFIHAWSFGEILPPAWYDDDYLIDQWWDYDLPAPPPGYDWVRVGDDALLIEEYSGRIVQVIRDLFW